MRFLCRSLAVFAAVLSFAFIAFKYGNIFYMSYAVNCAETISKTQYDGNINVIDYYYDKSLNAYIVEIADNNGIESILSYSRVSGVNNSYEDDCKSVVTNQIRGKFQNIISKTVDIPAVCHVSVIFGKNAILGEMEGECDVLTVDFGDMTAISDFAFEIRKVFDGVKNENFSVIHAKCKIGGIEYYYSSKKSDVPIDKDDILKRIFRQ